MSSTNRQNVKTRNRKLYTVIITLFVVIIVEAGLDKVLAADIYMFKDERGEVYYSNVAGHDRIKVRLPIINAGMKKKPYSKQAQLKSFTNSENTKTYEPIIAQASRTFSVDSDIVRAVIKAESNYNARAVSPKGAQGLMQLMPATARELGVDNPFDPVDNIHGGVRYLSQLLGVLNDNLPLALAAYNAGPLRVIGQKRIPAISETRQYVDRVLNYYKSFKVKDEK
jgi:soluble lytic murein transglycosylase-like protein